jgi:cobalt-precorrin-7 (C5)-methyltransferase
VSDEYDLDSGPDPATVAASAPEVTWTVDSESETATDPIHAVGIGPGAREFLTPRAKRAIQDADVVVGFETVVEFVDDIVTGEVLTCGYRDEAETLERFATRMADGASGTAVLMGDPNHSGYQFVGKVQSAIDRPVRVVPGISSLQVAASRARTPMEATTFVTLHKSGDITADLDQLCGAVGDRHLLVLPRPYDWMPGDIAETLLDSGASSSATALVLEELTHDSEEQTQTTLGSLAEHAGGAGPEDTPFSDLSVLAVRQG